MKALILKFRVFLFNCLTPILKFTATVHMPWTHKEVQGTDYYNMWPMLKPGTLFCTKIRGDLTDILVPGYYTHVGIYAPTKDQTVDESVIQAERGGVGRVDLVSFLLTKDDVLVLEPAVLGDKKDAIMARAVEIANSCVGDAYNFQFDTYTPTSKAFYCSELAWFAYDMACKEFGMPSLFTPTMELDDATVTPQGVAESKTFRTIYHAGGK